MANFIFLQQEILLNGMEKLQRSQGGDIYIYKSEGNSPLLYISSSEDWPARQYSTPNLCVLLICSRYKNTHTWMVHCFRPRFLHWKAVLGWGQPRLMRWIWYASCPRCRINCWTCWPAVQRATTVPWLLRVQEYILHYIKIFSNWSTWHCMGSKQFQYIK